MRKLILFLCLGIFLISFTSSLSTIVVKPLDAPTNVTLTNVSGTIPAGTYSIRLVHLGNMTDYISAPRLESPPSEIVNITLESTGGILINWTNSTNPWLGGSVSRGGTNIYIKNASAPITASQSWLLVISTGYVIKKGETYTMSNWTVSGYSPQIWMTDGSSPDPSVPFGLNKTGGTGLVYITGTSGTIYMSDIVDAINSSYGGTLPNTIVWDDFNRFYGVWTIAVQNSTTAGYFDVSGNTIWIWGGYYNPAYPLQIKASQTVQPTIFEFPPSQGLAIFAYWGNASLNNTIISSGALGMDSSYFGGTTQYSSYSNTYIWNSIIYSTYSKIVYQNTFKRTTFMYDVRVYYSGGKDYPLEDLTIMSGIFRLASPTGDDTYVKRLTMQTPCTVNQFDMRYTNAGYDKSLYLIDPIFTECSDLPRAYWYATYPTYPLYIGYSINAKVINSNGLPIQNANMTMIDVNGNVVLTQLTYSNGTMTEQYVFPVEMKRSAQTNGLTDSVTRNSPYNLSVSATGYKDYEMNNLNFSAKQDWTIALEEQPSWNYSEAPDFKILNNTKHTIFKLSPDGNLAIAGNLYENTNSPPLNVVWKIGSLFWFDDLGNLYIKGVISILS